MFNEAKEIMQEGDMEEFEMFFDAVKWEFDDIEERHKYAVDHKKADVEELGKQLDGVTTSYKAAMNVKFDLEEKKKEEEAEMEVEIPEEDELEIKSTIDYMVQKKDKDQITYMLQTAYDTMQTATIEHEKEADNEAKTVKY